MTKTVVVIYNLSAWAFIFLSQSFWWSEKPCLPLLKELGPADVGVSLLRQQLVISSSVDNTELKRWRKVVKQLLSIMYMWVYTCQCSSSSFLLLEASPQVHSAGREKVEVSLSVSVVQGSVTTMVLVCVLTSSSSLKTDAIPSFFEGSEGTGSLGF